MEQYLDSRDLEEELEELIENKNDHDRLKELERIKKECEGYGWEHGINFIWEGYFKEYAEELFDECYIHDIPDNLKTYIDYEKFARDLEMDYSTIEIGGGDYLFREA